MEQVGRADSSWGEALVFLVLGLATGAAAWQHVRRTAHPVIELSAFRVKTFAVATGGGSLFRISISAVPFLQGLSEAQSATPQEYFMSAMEMARLIRTT